jgi:hypothetical protein
LWQKKINHFFKGKVKICSIWKLKWLLNHFTWANFLYIIFFWFSNSSEEKQYWIYLTMMTY